MSNPHHIERAAHTEIPVEAQGREPGSVADEVLGASVLGAPCSKFHNPMIVAVGSSARTPNGSPGKAIGCRTQADEARPAPIRQERPTSARRERAVTTRGGAGRRRRGRHPERLARHAAVMVA